MDGKVAFGIAALVVSLVNLVLIAMPVGRK